MEIIKMETIISKKEQRKEYLRKLCKNFKQEKELWLICIPIIIWGLIFCYYPMGGLVMAFLDYVPGRSLLESDFVGLKHIIGFLTNPTFGQLLRNTLAMSILGLTIGFIAPILFALMLNEVKYVKFKKSLQTLSYLPHFISWVVAGSMIFMLLSNEGIINDILLRLGVTTEGIPFLSKGEYYWYIYTLANMWKGIGWSSIIYLSAIAGVDVELFEAGAVDGLGRWGIVRYIIIPSIMPTIVLLWILGVGNILNAGFDQHLILGTPATQNYWDVIDTYAYRYGVQQGYYSLGTAVSLIKSVIGFTLVYFTNKICAKKLSMSIF